MSSRRRDYCIDYHSCRVRRPFGAADLADRRLIKGAAGILLYQEKCGNVPTDYLKIARAMYDAYPEVQAEFMDLKKTISAKGYFDGTKLWCVPMDDAGFVRNFAR
jgi:hypothetical protein